MILSPDDVKINKISDDKGVGVFTFEPLPTGFGHTLGNTLRRILMTSLEGTAITQVSYENAVHQFTTIEGVKEDIVEINLSLKEVRATMHDDNPVIGKISKKGPGKITAGDIEVTSEVEIMNKDLHIATLADSKSVFEAEVVFERGVGYSRVEERETSKVGVILLDALYSPVLNAMYEVEPTRKGRSLGLDKLTLTIETDGSVESSDALAQAATLLRDFFKRFALAEDPEVEEKEEDIALEVKPAIVSGDILVEELPLPTRTINALRKAEVTTLALLATKSDEELSDIKNLGEKSIEEVTKLLIKEGLR